MLAREQGWYEADDRIDAALPFLNRDLGWEDRAWGATEHGFQLLLDRYVRPGDRVLELGAAKSWASQHLVPLGCEYVACDLVVDPLIGLGRGALLRAARRPVPARPGRRRAAAVRDRELRPRVLRRHAPPRARPARDGRRARARDAPRRRRGRAERGHPRARTAAARTPSRSTRRSSASTSTCTRCGRTSGRSPRAGLRPLRLEYAEGPAELRRRKIAGKLLRLGELPSTLWALNAYPYAGLSLFARRR